MRNTVITTIIMILGAFLTCLGLIYLKSQVETTNLLVEKVTNEVSGGNDNVYQQSSDANRSVVTEEELYAMIMGYREYPIIINGNKIDPEGEDFDTYITYITDGSYIKTYGYNSYREIEKIIITRTGT